MNTHFSNMKEKAKNNVNICSIPSSYCGGSSRDENTSFKFEEIKSSLNKFEQAQLLCGSKKNYKSLASLASCFTNLKQTTALVLYEYQNNMHFTVLSTFFCEKYQSVHKVLHSRLWVMWVFLGTVSSVPIVAKPKISHLCLKCFKVLTTWQK